ncbi:MAG: efflux RND transporter periplasmic adaptor subunit, partial [Burkholderiaceae bacterium]|nr:efflux RND transporter periplasmic adaptor subunit [Burkholderiaceae bacterium]
NALNTSTAQKAAAPLQLQADEVVTVQRLELPLNVPVSGSLRAIDSAMVKARVGGELMGLTVREGDRVKTGQEIARTDPTESRARLRQAQQQADAAKSQVDINQRQYTNNQALVDQGFISATALVTSQASLQAAQSTYQAAVSAADIARKLLDDTVLRSPINGIVAQRLAQPGERVPVDGRVVEVVDLSRLELEAMLSPADSLAVRVGQSAKLTIEGAATPVAATVVRINPSAQAGSRAVPVYLRIDQTDSSMLLRQGLFVQGTLETGRINVLTVPLDAVRTDKPTPYVQMVKDGRVVHTTVKTGTRTALGGQTLVSIEGVPEGSAVVTGRIGMLREGTAVSYTAPRPAP